MVLRLRPLRSVLFAGLLAAAAVPVRAELVVLDNGHFFKVSAYELVGEERMRLTLPSGGRITLALARIERVLDDEIVREPVPAPGPPAPSWRFGAAEPVPATPYGELIYAASRRHAVSPALVAAVVRAESAFDPRAVSAKGARGLMQLMPATAHRFGVAHHELLEPGRNLEAGTFYLRWLLDRFEDDLPRVLAAYNAGEGTVDRYGGVPPYRETRDYIRRIYASLGIAAAEAPAAAR